MNYINQTLNPLSSHSLICIASHAVRRFTRLVLVSFTLLWIPSLVTAQDIDLRREIDTLPDASKINYKDWVINIQLNDSINVDKIDSIINLLEEKRKTRESKNQIFGHSWLEADSLSVYQPNTVVNVPDNYVIGVGDEISVAIFGASQLDAKFIVDESGSINPQGLARLYLKGLNWGQAKELLARRFSSFYIFRREQIAITLSQPRQVVVNLLGEVQRPGSYNLVATNTALNALIAGGGVRPVGSVRNIRLAYGDRQRTLDLYKLMDDPTVQFSFYLEDNVVIQVPSSGAIVEIAGAVKRPMKYELLEGENISDLLRYAGGLTGDANTDFLQIKRFVGNRQMIIDISESEWKKNSARTLLKDGDVVMIRTIGHELKNYVAVEGAVFFPGDYDLEATTTVSQLIHKAVPSREARLDVAFLLRLNPDQTIRLIEIDLHKILAAPNSAIDLALEEGDRIVINQLSDYVEISTIAVEGAVRKPIEHPFDPDANVTVQQALLLAGGLIDEANDFGYILRTDRANKHKKEYIKVNLRQALTSSTSPENKILRPMDKLIAIASSQLTDLDRLFVKGAVRSEIDTIYHYEGIKLKDVLLLSGGLRNDASGVLDIFRIEADANGMTKTNQYTIKVDQHYEIIDSPNDFALQPLDRIVARTKAEYRLQQVVRIRGQVKFAGEYALTSHNETLGQFIEKAGGLQKDALLNGVRIIRRVTNPSTISQTVELVADLSSTEGSAIILKPLDEIVVPQNENIVLLDLRQTRAGKLFDKEKNIAVKFVKGKNALWYINEYAGGLPNRKLRNNIVVVSPNGAVKPVLGSWPFRKYPEATSGSTIAILALPVDKKSTEASSKLTHNKGVIVNISPSGEESPRLERNEDED